jgi:hypothetical protein
MRYWDNTTSLNCLGVSVSRGIRAHHLEVGISSDGSGDIVDGGDSMLVGKEIKNILVDFHGVTSVIHQLPFKGKVLAIEIRVGTGEAILPSCRAHIQSG